MIEQRIRETSVDPQSLLIVWLGEAGFVFKDSRGRVIYIDPYLSNSVGEAKKGWERLIPPPIKPEDVQAADIVAITHCHLAHQDPQTLVPIARNTNTRFVCPANSRNELLGMGIQKERIHSLRIGDALELDGLRFEAVYAHHMPPAAPAPGAIGLLIFFENLIVYHAGDTEYVPEKMTRVLDFPLDLCFLPINGLGGNMNADEAAQFCSSLGSRLFIPMHYSMFRQQDCDPQRFVRACRKMESPLPVRLLSPGIPFLFKRDDFRC